MQNKYLTLFDLAPIGYFTIDKIGVIQEVNLTGANLLSVERKYLIKIPFSRYVATAYQDVFYSHRKQLFETKIQQTCELKLVNNGTQFHAQLESIVVPDSEGNFSQFRTAITDISERKRAEEAIQESNRRLEETLDELKATQQRVIQQEYLRAPEQLVGSVAHYFNNALTAIWDYSNLLLMVPEILDDREKVNSCLELIRAVAKEAGRVVSRLREFCRQREEGETFDINQLVKQTIKLTQPMWKAQARLGGITINMETYLNKVPLINGNETVLQEGLSNLIFNAVDAMKESGTITFHTRSDGTDVFLEAIF